MNKLTALSPTGMLGYGIPKESLNNAIEKYDIDYIAVDAGSTDQGPDYLGRGKFLASKNMVKRDLRLLLEARNKLKVPLLISSAGGSGSETHVDKTAEIIREIAAEDGLEFSLSRIYTDVNRDLLKQKIDTNDLQKFDYQVNLTHDDIDEAEEIVGLIGPDPYMKALRDGADVILGGRSVDESPFAALPLLEGFDEGLTFHMAKILECGAMAAEPRSGSDCLIGTITSDSFTLEPTAPNRRCTEQSVAAHTLYEKADPYVLHLPGGQVDVSVATFEQETERRVRVTGSSFEPASVYTILAEGVTQRGYRTITPAGIRGLEATTIINDIVDDVKEKVAGMVQYEKNRYQLIIRQYGKDGVPITSVEPLATNGELGIIIDVIGDSQEVANTVCGTARSTMLHHSFEGRLAVSGNLAIPYSPADIELGPTYEFSIHHLLANIEPADIYTIEKEMIL